MSLSSSEIRQQFLSFFESKGHTIVPSAPIVIKNDPTLLFTNAGMNQFKDYFLGNKPAPYKRAADTQKCLRVSGKHNDLEEVGVDTYHHTMFEMLGNWSFGDYFKAEAIAWSWELLTEVYKLDKDKLYVTIFEGDEKEGLPRDYEAYDEWKKWIGEDRILLGNKKDNFWEMGDTGPCGPCTEIHVDCRSEEDRKAVDGASLVNSHPDVIEIWNNVFMQFNRKKDGSLENLPAKHVDTGLGFERLVRVIQNKTSNYDTDIFSGTIAEIEKITGKKYDYSDSKEAVAFRVLADHIRAICFTIADGQLPSNTGAGYVVRRILRRAVRYYYSYLETKEPLLHKLVPMIAKQFENVFPELNSQLDFVSKVILEEENGFLRTLEKGLEIFNKEKLTEATKFFTVGVAPKIHREFISGKTAFKLFDTYGFPIDLTCLIAQEKGWDVDLDGFKNEMFQQKNRSRAATAINAGDWIEFEPTTKNTFVGYTKLESETKVIKYRKVNAKGKDVFQIVLEETPFYAESGGQIGDAGTLTFINPLTTHHAPLTIFDTKKEGDLIIHFADSIPDDLYLSGTVIAKVDVDRRKKITLHHTATHLLQAALRKVLGTHVAQKGSLNGAENLRFDFSHFAKMTNEEIASVEKLVNEKIRENIPVVIEELPKEEALKLGAMALFGEKYGDIVRVVVIDPNYSVELCGGTHVAATGELGFFKITSEGSVAAGVRRIEAVTGEAAENFVSAKENQLATISEALKNPKEILKSIEYLQTENAKLKKQIEHFEARQLVGIRNELLTKDEIINQINFIGDIVEVTNAEALRKLCTDLKNHLQDFVIVLCANIGGQSSVAVCIADNVVAAKQLDAGKIIKQHIAPLIKGGGGGQKNMATAGGQDASRLQEVIDAVKGLL